VPLPCHITGLGWPFRLTAEGGSHHVADCLGDRPLPLVEIKQEGSTLHIATLTRGLSVEEGGYHWSGELRLWDNEIVMGWYAANDGSIRSKGTMYFVVHPHGLSMSGRQVGRARLRRPDHDRLRVNGPQSRGIRADHGSAGPQRR
jgi:hypothetical protein